MNDREDLIVTVRDLTDALHLQAEQLEKLIAHVERQTGRLPHVNEMSVVLSSLSELQVRLDHLRDRVRPPAGTIAAP